MIKKAGMVGFLLLLSFTLVIAAGGGGGSSSSSSSGGSSGGSSSSGGDGPHLSKLKCYDTGQLTFEQKPAFTPVVLETADGTKLTVVGTWDGALFTSDEGEIKEPGTYTIRDPKNGDKSVSCPGLRFSCKLAEMKVLDCKKTAKGVEARFLLKNTPLEELEYTFSVDGKTKKYALETQALELKGLQVSKGTGDEYTLTVSADADKLQISHPQCIGQYYLYSQKECVAAGEEPMAEESGKKLKCGGYLDIKDRVKCRVGLRKEQAKEYENFFPEECRSWKNQDQCVKLYQKVQDCWEKKRGSQIACLRQKVGVLDVKQQKLACGKDQACLDKLKGDVFTLIKLRLYHLEEEAEELQEEGTITEEELVNFVVQMEQSKLAFNEAASKQERKDVLLQAQKHWQELLKKVKP